MHSFLALLRLLGMFVATVTLAPLALASRLAGWLGQERLARRSAAEIQALWGRACMMGMRISLDLPGVPPAGRYLVVSNHLSYVDIWVLAALFPGRFVAKSEIATWPFLGHLARLAGSLFVEQARARDVLRVGAEMERTLAHGVRIVLFPEGHASRGARVERIHSSLLEMAVRNQIPCLPVTLRYETPADPWSPAATVCWWGGMGFVAHMRGLLGLHGIRVRVRWAPAPLVGQDRKALAADLQRELEQRFEPIAQGPLPPDYPWPELFGAQPVRSELAGEPELGQELGQK